MRILDEQISAVEQAAAIELRGQVAEVKGLALRVSDLGAPVGALVRTVPRSTMQRWSSESRNRSTGEGPTHDGAGRLDGTLPGEVVGFDREFTIVMPYGSTRGVQRGDQVIAEQFVQSTPVGDALIGRVLNGFGRPIDGKGPLLDTVARPLVSPPVEPLDRPLIDQPLATGVRAVDALISVGQGQRVGVFAAPGLGKSTMLGLMAQNTSAQVSVVALVGERGREVRDFIDNHLGQDGLGRSVVIRATSDEPALMRIRAAMAANTAAEFFREQGKEVLLIMDSVTRFCQAQRQVGLAAGEPPATRGYPPSVFSMLPGLLERSGRTKRGSITGLYAVLVEGDDLNEPIADAARSVLDGHIILSQALATKGHWPAVDVSRSISRLADAVTDAEQQAARAQVLALLGAYEGIEDLLNIGAYAAGSNRDADLAIACKPAIDQLLKQGSAETGTNDFNRTRQQLLALLQQIRTLQAQLSRPQTRVPQGPVRRDG